MNSIILTFGEILLRFSPSYNKRIKEMQSLDISLGGSELNVAIALRYLGQNTQMLSAVPKNDLGDRILSGLASHFIDTKKVIKTGDKIGTYYYEQGISMRPANVIYDRKDSSIHKLVKKNTLDFGNIFADISTIHISGITCALSKEVDDFVYQLVRNAKDMGVKISFDFNFRSKLWSFQEARESYLRILPFVDYCFAGFNDFSSIINIQNNEHEQFSEERLLKYYQKYHELYGIEYFASTKRDVISSSTNCIQGFLFNNNRLYKSKPNKFSVEERIGAGDAFAAGVLHGILQGWMNKEIVEFGTMSGILKHSLKGDYSNYTEDEILQVMKTHSSDVRR